MVFLYSCCTSELKKSFHGVVPPGVRADAAGNFNNYAGLEPG